MIIKLKDLQKDVMGIYKINFKNGKCYIGQSKDIRRRMFEHNNKNKAKTLCDLAIKEQGVIYEIEILEFINDYNMLNEREIYWISYYKSNNKEYGYNIETGGNATGEGCAVSIFSNEQVYDIRKRRFQGERKINVYKDYKNYSFNSFENIWLGYGYQEVGKEFIINTNTYDRQYYSSKANSGENNNKAKLNKNDVIAIRERYNNGEIPSKIHKDYDFVSLLTITRVCYKETWKNI